ncbi:MAG: hypothetical protein HUJ78_06965 [Mogibacterium sp.]|nr:hypothetical protein [Mogibacterium sp.]
MVISKYALDCKPYLQSGGDITWGDITWGECTLRKWLNDEFINEAFGTEHQKLIPTVVVSADKNPENDTNPGKSTKDKVFLLSIKEAEKYFANDEAWMCAPTAYAKANGVYTDDDYTTEDGEATCWWWLRSPGYTQFYAACVNFGGYVFNRGCNVLYVEDGVRPALWINLEP